MSKNKIFNIVLAPTFVLVLSIFTYLFSQAFANFIKKHILDLINALITLGVGTFAIVIYRKQKQDEKNREIKQKADKKRDAAKIIFQEIRRAEKILDNYKQHSNYVFSKKIIATDSWAKNIHYFVGNLDNDKLDKISALYSMGKYLDSIIQ